MKRRKEGIVVVVVGGGGDEVRGWMEIYMVGALFYGEGSERMVGVCGAGDKKESRGNDLYK